MADEYGGGGPEYVDGGLLVVPFETAFRFGSEYRV